MISSNRHETPGNNKKTKVFGVALGAMLFALCLPAQAQQAAKVPRIGYVSFPVIPITRDATSRRSAKGSETSVT